MVLAGAQSAKAAFEAKKRARGEGPDEEDQDEEPPS
jgi:hypothetical protein